jgi:CubicO group peptidase (beta-lactamase class C family)
MASAPGEKAVYCSCNPNLALGVVSRATGESPYDLFDRLVAYPMKIERYGWGGDRAGNPYGGGGMQLLPRDFMKFGQLMLNGGSWGGYRILGCEFVARASAPLYHLRGLYYGYLWWSVDYPYKDRTIRGFYAGGAGGQSVIVFPDLDLVIASFGGNYSSTGTFFMQRTVVPRDLLPAVREARDDKHATVVPREDYALKIGPTTETGQVVQPQ